MPSVIELAKQYRASLEKQDTQALNRLVKAYGAIYNRLQDKIELLVRDIGDGELTRAQVERLERYQTLIAQTSRELKQFQGYTAGVLDETSLAAIDKASKDSLGLMNASANEAGISATFNRLPKGAIEKLLGFLDKDGPLYKRLDKLAPFTADKVSETILSNVGLGKNPRAYAGLIRDQLGIGLTDALRMTRTVQLYSYREAARANYVANSDIIEGWIWYAELDESTCISCIAQHGTVHPLDETLNDHHNGRCAALPQIVDADNPVKESGEDWFNNLSESQQQAAMGKGRFEAFQAGKFELGDLSRERDDDVYGKMRVVASLDELV